MKKGADLVSVLPTVKEFENLNFKKKQKIVVIQFQVCTVFQIVSSVFEDGEF